MKRYLRSSYIAMFCFCSTAHSNSATAFNVEYRTCMASYEDIVRASYDEHPEWGPFDAKISALNYKAGCRDMAISRNYPKNVNGIVFVAPGAFDASTGTQDGVEQVDGGELFLGILAGVAAGAAGNIGQRSHIQVQPHIFGSVPAQSRAGSAFVARPNTTGTTAVGSRPASVNNFKPSAGVSTSSSSANSGVNVNSAGKIVNPVIQNGRATFVSPLDKQVHTTTTPCASTVQSGPLSYACR